LGGWVFSSQAEEEEEEEEVIDGFLMDVVGVVE
jgi:hypothetical protein